MNCPVCGSPNADGAAFCGACGSPLGQQNAQQYQQQPNMQYQQPNMQYQQPNAQYQQPNMQYQQQPNMQYQQPNMQYQQQPNMQYQQPMQNQRVSTGNNFADIIRQQPLKIVTYVGFFFLFLASFLPWVSAFGIGAGLWAPDGGILKLWAILLLLTAVCGILIEFGSLIPALNSIADTFKKLPFSQFYLPALALIIWIICICNSLLRSSVKFGAHWGIGMWLCIIGVVLLLVRPVLAIIQKKNYWD